MSHPLIVIINDDLAFLQMISEVLVEEGYQTVIVEENRNAYEVISSRMPALVILELLIYNPEAGLTIVNKMRLNPQTTHIPVIIASTVTDLIQRNEEHLRSKRCDILKKPFELEDLLVMAGKYAPLTQ